MEAGRVVVGVDGSAPSRAALRWASQDASRRNTSLLVLSAYTGVVAGLRPMVSLELRRAQQEQGEMVVREALAEVRATVAPADGRAVLGDPAGVLLDASRTASLLVVGSHGRGGLAGLVVGSVSQQVALHAACPVVVVRGRTDAVDGPVLVGVDGSASSHFAVELAFEQAAARGCAVLIVFGYEPPFGFAATDIPVLLYDDDRLRSDVDREFTQAVAGWRDKHPTVLVEAEFAAGRPGPVLAEASRRAQLVVVGSRGHGGFAGLLLGSVGLHLLHHADCPVLIARDNQEG
jgi:nucleotide-binding universal stress UspA family protein